LHTLILFNTGNKDAILVDMTEGIRAFEGLACLTACFFSFIV
jgi:hypothetical protein